MSQSRGMDAIMADTLGYAADDDEGRVDVAALFDESEFCVVHGYEHMRCDRGPIAYCTECERDNGQFGAGA